MRKTYSLCNIIALLLICLFCTACSDVFNGTGGDIGAKAGNKQEEVLHEDVTLSLVLMEYSPNTKEFWMGSSGFISRFEKEYPYIKLDVQFFSWDNIQELMERLIASNNAPDILNIDIYNSYEERGLLENNIGFIPDNYAVPSLMCDEYALPLLASPRGMFCNNDILDKAGISQVPTDREGILAACRAVKGIMPEGFPLGIDISDYSAWDTFGYYTYAAGGGFLDESGNRNLGSDVNINTLEFIKSLKAEGLCQIYNGNGASAAMRDDFINGKLASIMAPLNFKNKLSGMNVSIKQAAESVNAGTIAALSDSLVVFKKDSSNENNRLNAIKSFFTYLYEEDIYKEYADAEGFSIPLEGMKSYPINKKDWQDIKREAKSLLDMYLSI